MPVKSTLTEFLTEHGVDFRAGGEQLNMNPAVHSVQRPYSTNSRVVFSSHLSVPIKIICPTRPTVANTIHLLFSKFTHPISTSTVMTPVNDTISHVLFSRTPTKVFNTIVARIAIQMTAFHTIRTRTNKSQQNQMMQGVLLRMPTKPHSDMPAVAGTSFQPHPKPRTRFTPKTAIITHSVRRLFHETQTSKTNVLLHHQPCSI